MENISEDPSSFFDRLIEPIEVFIGDDPFLSKEILEARESFIQITGGIRENAPNYENRMNSFLLWFIFDWEVKHFKKKPFQIYLEHQQAKGYTIPSACIQMDPHLHSIFEYIKQKKKTIAIVKDLFTGKKYKIEAPYFIESVEPGIYFESRIFFFEEEMEFGNYFIIHPLEVKRNIWKQIKLLRKKPKLNKKLIYKLQSFHTKWEHYSNMDLNFIYHFDRNLPQAK